MAEPLFLTLAEVLQHPFVDGNKRAGTHAAIAFLEMNNFDLDFPTDETEQLVLRVAAGSATKEEVTAFFRSLTGK